MAQGPSGFGSQFVEITGAPNQVTVSEESPTLAGQTVNPNGKLGRVFPEGDGKFGVHTFDGLYLTLPEANLQEHHPLEATKGGFDLAWPEQDDEYRNFGHMVCEHVLAKGYCVIQTYEGGKMRSSILDDSSMLSDDFEQPRAEFMEAYLGRSSSSSSLRFLPTTAELNELEETNEWNTETNCVHYYMEYLRNLSYLLMPGNADLLGFKPVEGVTGALLRQPLPEPSEPIPLFEENVEDGSIERFLDFVQRRKVCLLYVIDTEGGDIELHPRADLDQPDVTIPLVRDRILAFRNDMMSFSYKPSGLADLAMQGWCLEVPQEIRLDTYEGSQTALQEVIGGGPPQVPSEQVHIMCGMCHFPANGDRMSGAWLDWMTCTDTFIEVPMGRWDFEPYYSAEDAQVIMGKSCTKHVGFISDHLLKNFDNTFFNIDSEVAIHMQPINRLLLETAYETFDLVGYDMQTIQGKPIASFIADIGPDWDYFTGYNENPEAWSRANIGITSLARMNFHFNLKGPAYQLDTACSTTLVSANLAEKVIRQHVERGVNEAVSLGLQNVLTPWPFIGLSGAGMLGRGGRCLTFDRSANGYNRGEGVGGLFLKCSSSLNDVQDRIGCYVSGFINQDGRSASLTAPNGPSQQECMRASLKLAGITTSKVDVNENHGTGTALGDPIECGSIRSVFRGRGANALPVTSGKSHMGHLESTAGSVGLLKTLATLINSCVAPNVHLRHLNPHIEFDGFPGCFPIEQMDLNTEHACGSLNSFGFGGTNSRGDLWARCLKGYRETGSRKLAIERLDWVTVPCARCMGPMHWLDGMALTESTPPGKHKCRAVRELLQSYEYCSNCYEGGYIFGGPDQMNAIGYGAAVGIVGSWSNFTTVDQMDIGPSGRFECDIVLGDTCLERFYIVLDGNFDKAFYPAVAKASASARVCGPGKREPSRCWLINGRQDGMPTGTVYKIGFQWQLDGQISMSWVSTAERVSPILSDYQPSYAIVGSFTDWAPAAMERSPTDPAVWLFTAAVQRKSEHFLFMCNGDQEQLIYPLEEETIDITVPVMGPDEGGMGKAWLISGKLGDTLEVRLKILDGDITVTASTEAVGEVTWQSARGPVKEAFFVVGSFTRGAFALMEEDLTEKGIFKLRFMLTGAGKETFQIVVNNCPAMRMYPMTDKAPPGVGLVCGPDAKDEGKSWEVVGRPYQAMEIMLEVGADDQTQVVTCLPVPPELAITG